MHLRLLVAFVFSILLACERKTLPVAPIATATPDSAPAPKPASPPALEPAPNYDTEDGEFVGSVAAKYLGGKACLNAYLQGNYAPDFIYTAKEQLSLSGIFSNQPCDLTGAVAVCKNVDSDFRMTETFVGYYYGISLEVAQKDCADDGGSFNSL